MGIFDWRMGRTTNRGSAGMDRGGLWDHDRLRGHESLAGFGKSAKSAFFGMS